MCLNGVWTVDMEALVDAGEYIMTQLGRNTRSRVAAALLAKRARARTVKA